MALAQIPSWIGGHVATGGRGEKGRKGRDEKGGRKIPHRNKFLVTVFIVIIHRLVANGCSQCPLH